MEFELKKEPKKPIIIEGFPGFGFVSTIATEFLIKHLKAEKIGRIASEDFTPIVGIHKSEIVDPLEVYYNKKYNLVILRSLTEVTGSEWKLAKITQDLGGKLNAQEIISIEGISEEKGKTKEKGKAYFFTNSKDKKKRLNKADLSELEDGIIKGVTAALILELEKAEIPVSCIFVKAHPGLPDSKAAGEVVKALDKYLGLKVDYKPLIKTGEEVEKKLKKFVKQVKKAREKQGKEVKEKESYLG